MIVDAHVHFWDPGELDYPWLAPIPSLRRAFLADDYAPASGAARMVVVEANCMPAQAAREVEFIERLAERDSRIAAIVAYVDLTAPSRDAAFDALRAQARVKGIRRNIQGEPRGFCLQRAFVDGACEAGRRGYTFDLCITADQLPEAIALVEQCGETRFVLDHCGKPRIRDGHDIAWFADLERLARFDHVWCKISGLLTEAAPNTSHEALAAYTRHAVDCFGADRVMYGSDWPVLTLAGDATRWPDHARALTAGWPDNDVQRFYCENAKRFYGI
jgi:L-fuconolactonase